MWSRCTQGPWQASHTAGRRATGRQASRFTLGATTRSWAASTYAQRSGLQLRHLSLLSRSVSVSGITSGSDSHSQLRLVSGQDLLVDGRETESDQMHQNKKKMFECPDFQFAKTPNGRKIFCTCSSSQSAFGSRSHSSITAPTEPSELAGL